MLPSLRKKKEKHKLIGALSLILMKRCLTANMQNGQLKNWSKVMIDPFF